MEESAGLAQDIETTVQKVQQDASKKWTEVCNLVHFYWSILIVSLITFTYNR